MTVQRWKLIHVLKKERAKEKKGEDRTVSHEDKDTATAVVEGRNKKPFGCQKKRKGN